MKNFISHETIVLDDKDRSRLSKWIKSLIQEGTLLLETFQKNRNSVGCKIPREAIKHTDLYSESFWIIKEYLWFHHCITKMNIADQCSLISNSSELPSKLEYLTQSRLSSITFSKDDIAKMIQNLDPNKAHSHHQISIRMLQLCSTSICKPVEIIFSQCLERGMFLNDWKKSNNVPIFKKTINKLSKTTVQSGYFLCVVKYLRN